jgi:hypothetical protein
VRALLPLSPSCPLPSKPVVVARLPLFTALRLACHSRPGRTRKIGQPQRARWAPETVSHHERPASATSTATTVAEHDRLAAGRTRVAKPNRTARFHRSSARCRRMRATSPRVRLIELLLHCSHHHTPTGIERHLAATMPTFGTCSAATALASKSNGSQSCLDTSRVLSCCLKAPLPSPSHLEAHVNLRSLADGYQSSL